MSGNVWEWCRTKWRSNYNSDPDDKLDGEAARVLRGGSYFNYWPQERSRRLPAYWYHPDDRNGYLGFRVVASQLRCIRTLVPLVPLVSGGSGGKAPPRVFRKTGNAIKRMITMPTEEDLSRYRLSLKTERDAALLYVRLAEAEPNPDLQKVYQRLSATELQHAELWAGKLRDAGAPVPEYGAGWRTVVLGWMAKRFGPSFVLPTIAGLESKLGADYSRHPGPDAAAMVAESRSHALLVQPTRQNVARFAGQRRRALRGAAPRAAGGNALRAGVLGANDGLVSVFSLVMGVAGAGVGTQVILLTGVAGLLAGALSMALGEWLSVQSSRELYEHQIGIEQRELVEMPEEEMAELTLIYQAKGVAPDEARRLAERLLSDESTALDTLAREELGIDPEELGGSAWEAALMSFILFAIGAAIPVFPYLIWSGTAGIIASSVLQHDGSFRPRGRHHVDDRAQPAGLRAATGGLRSRGRGHHVRHRPADRRQRELIDKTDRMRILESRL